MNKLLLLFFTLISHFASGQTQTIWFQMQRVNYCTKETVIDSNYFYLADMLGNQYKNVRGKVFLPAAGEYQIFYPTQPDIIFPVINIQKDTNIYTHYDSKIRVGLGFDNGVTYVYKDCNGLLNGEHEDYYEDGIVKMRGNFKNGIPKDSISIFHPNGIPYKSIIYLPRHLYIKEFDSLARVVKISHYGTENSASPNYTATTFYPNGNIHIAEKSYRGIIQFTEYYEGKRLKVEMTRDWRKEYTPAGTLETMYKWKEKAARKPPYIHKKFEITRTSYDASGRKTEEIKYHTPSFNKQPQVGLGSAAYFVYWKKFSPDGQEELVLRNRTIYEVVTQGLLRY